MSFSAPFFSGSSLTSEKVKFNVIVSLKNLEITIKLLSLEIVTRSNVLVHFNFTSIYVSISLWVLEIK